MKIKETSDTIIAPLTPAVGGTVTLLRISGTEAIAITNRQFNGIDLMSQPGGRFFHGQIINDKKEIIDDVIVYVFKKPNSYTGEDVIEISSHGNPFIVEEIIRLYLSKGCRMAEPGEFSKRAFLNGKMDLIQAEAVADLIAAKSKAIAKNSIRNIEGRLSQLITTIKDSLLNTAALLELDLDFSEENLEIITPDQVNKEIDQAIAEIDSLLQSYNYGKILSRGIEVLITGKPNVGKSSLMNALLERDRVIVSSLPGTTRDIIHEDIVINNVMVRFIDTAGIHLAQDSIEAEGVDRAIAMMERADVLLLVVDSSEELTTEDTNLLKTLSLMNRDQLILLANKIDKQVHQHTKTSLEKTGLLTVYISAKTGQNIQDLKELIIKKIYHLDQNLAEEILITNQRQFTSLEKTKDFLIRAKQGMANKVGFEFIALDIRNSIDCLAEISGEIVDDDILNTIFAHFCIGK